MNFGYGPISDMARDLLNMKQNKMIWDRHFWQMGAAGGAAAPAMPGGGGGGGGGTAKPNDAEWEKYRAESQAKRDAEQKASDAEWSGMMKSAATQVANQSSSSTLPRTQFSSMDTPSPSGVIGMENAPTDQNGGTQSRSSGGSEEYASEDEEDKESGYTQTSDSSDGSSGYMKKGGRVQAGKKYIVGEGGDPEVYMQDDGDMYGLNQRMGIVPEEDGTIIPHDKLRMLARKHLARGR